MKDKFFGVMQRVGRSFMRRSAKGTDENAAKEVKGKTGNSRSEDVTALIARGLGGTRNISDMDCCVTRLRITVNNPNIVKEEDLKKSGAAGVIKKGNDIQVIYGPGVTGIKYDLEEYLIHGGSDSEITAKGSQIVKEEINFEGIENGVNEMKSGKDIIIYSPVKGRAVELEAVGDGVFSSRMLGDGIAVEPALGRVVAPVSGTVTMVFETKHAIGITSDSGVEVLIHIGIDTVELKGKYFTAYVKNGDQVNTGDLLVEFDMDSITQEGYSVITMVVITNTTDYKAVKPVISGPVEEEEELIKISR